MKQPVVRWSFRLAVLLLLTGIVAFSGAQEEEEASGDSFESLSVSNIDGSSCKCANAYAFEPILS